MSETQIQKVDFDPKWLENIPLPRQSSTFDQAKKIVAAVSRGETVAVTMGDEVIRIFGPLLPQEGVARGDLRFDAIVANTNRATGKAWR